MTKLRRWAYWGYMCVVLHLSSKSIGLYKVTGGWDKTDMVK